MIQLAKVRGSTMYNLSYNDEAMTKLIVWEINPYDVDLDTLQDIINTVRPPIPPTVPAIPLGHDPLRDLTRVLQNYPDAGVNAGAEAADRAAREEEMRLRNMGSAISKGIGLGPDDIPVVDVDRVDLPDVNWGV